MTDRTPGESTGASAAPLRRLRILHLTAGSDAGGLTRYILDMAAAAKAAGHEVVVAGERGAWHDRIEPAGVTWIEVPLKGGPLALARAARRLSDYLTEHPADVFHAHYRRANLVARLLQRRHHAPLLYTVHQPNISLFGPRRWLTDFGDVTHVPSEEARDWVIREGRVAPDRVRLIHHGIDPERFPLASDQDRAHARQLLGLSPDQPVAGFVGRFDVPKNEQWMLELAAQSRGKLDGLKVILAGEGPHESALRQRIERESLGDRVLLVPRETPPLQIYRAIDALMVPSLREGFSLVSAEAMSVGRPVLRTQTGGTAAQIIPGRTGRSVPIDQQAFVAAAVEFMSDRAALREMGQNAAAHVRSNLTFARQAEKTINLYAELAARTRLV
jgi:glycosyltransferase involved in cell wall biosynthesis